MSIYVLNTIFTILWGVLLLNRSGKTYKKLYITFISIQMILLSGMRDITIGADTCSYENHFYELINPELNGIYGWKPLFANLLNFGESYNTRDIGYELLSKAFASLIPNFRFFLFAIAIFVCMGLGRFLYKYSSDICLSYVLFQAFILPFMLLTGIRQTIAISLVVFWGYDLVKQRKAIKYIVLCLIGMMFHFTAVIAIPFYFICNYQKVISMKYPIVMILTLIILGLKNILFRIIPLGIYSQYAQSSGIQSYSFIAFMILIVIAIFILDKSRNVFNKKRDIINLVDGTIIAELCTTSSVIVDIFFRLGFYYFPYMICCFPIFFESLDNKSKKVAKIFFYMGMTYYIYLRKDVYAFCF